MRLPSMLVFAAVIAAAAPASAAGKTEELKDEPDPMARICNAFGPGFTLVPGTTTCIKIGGYVRGSVTFTNKGGQGNSGPGGNAPVTPPPR